MTHTTHGITHHAKRSLETGKFGRHRFPVNGSGKQRNGDFWRQNGRERWNFECLQACRPSEPIVCTSNMMFLTSHRIQNTSTEAWKQAKSKKGKKKAKSADLVVLSQSQREKNLKIPFSHRGINIFQNPFNSIFVNLNANFPETPKVKRGLGEEKLRFLCFFWSRVPMSHHTKNKHKTGRSKKSAGSLGLIFCGC